MLGIAQTEACPLYEIDRLSVFYPFPASPKGSFFSRPACQKNSDKVKTISRKIEDFLDEIKPRTREKDNATRIGELMRDGLLPRHIGNLMHAIRVSETKLNVMVTSRTTMQWHQSMRKLAGQAEITMDERVARLKIPQDVSSSPRTSKPDFPNLHERHAVDL